MSIKRSYDRSPTELRPVSLEVGFYDYAEGSCLVSFGKTKVLCVTTLEGNVPPHVKGTGRGWITAEYSMLPRSSPERIRRERSSVGGRTQEIQRLIGRALRSVFRLQGWGERSLIVDCDVLQADGGTRTAAITGAFISTVLAFRTLGKKFPDLKAQPFPAKEFMSAISVGLVGEIPVLDLDYLEDSTAHTDMNLIATSSGRLVEIQGTAEKEPMEQKQFTDLLNLGLNGIDKLAEMQKNVLTKLHWEV